MTMGGTKEVATMVMVVTDGETAAMGVRLISRAAVTITVTAGTPDEELSIAVTVLAALMVISGSMTHGNADNYRGIDDGSGGWAGEVSGHDYDRGGSSVHYDHNAASGLSHSSEQSTVDFADYHGTHVHTDERHIKNDKCNYEYTKADIQGRSGALGAEKTTQSDAHHAADYTNASDGGHHGSFTAHKDFESSAYHDFDTKAVNGHSHNGSFSAITISENSGQNSSSNETFSTQTRH
ncbi:hypothetical protein IWQ60_007584 [Tieghemiomyces parasiticus]|uniref:Uncharacterized protein n=1 Tax=Tieghemiomyces parasiticus TaxID=78921 RepID=A0A9W8A0D1_9FUNG|nr:hypothetical protein IWQ60_007584 [Tieghemiomyces parasiticus]